MVAAISRRRFCWIAAGALAVLSLPGCSSANDGTVVIYSCAEGVRNESLITAMHARFPEYDIRLHYIPTGNCAAKLRMEGSQSEADIVLDLEGGYIKQVSEWLDQLPAQDAKRYCADLVDPDHRYFPFARESACIAVNETTLSAHGLEAVYQFTSSGSGPVNALVQGEAAIGLGMTFQAVSEINQGVPLKVLFFEEGAPWAVYGMGIVEGKGSRAAVREVFDWLSTEGVKIDNETYVPDQVLADFKAEIPNYPTDIDYADMTGITDPDEKKRLLGRWKY